MKVKPYIKLNNKWYRGRCDDCNNLIQNYFAKRCKKCASNFRLTLYPMPTHIKPHSRETKDKISNIKKKYPTNYWLGRKRLDMTGRNHHNWKGGITNENEKIRKSTEYKYWRSAVFERDNYTCQICKARSGSGKTVILNADHIKPFALYPELRLDTKNGRTLCKQCHLKTETYGRLSIYNILNEGGGVLWKKTKRPRKKKMSL